MQTLAPKSQTSYGNFSLTQDLCKQLLSSYFLPVPEGEDIDYRFLLLTADNVRLRSSGQVSSRAFLLTRHPQLGNSNALEAITEPDGRERIQQAATAVIADYWF